MTKKDILIFLNIYLTNIKDSVNYAQIDYFRGSVINLLKEFFSYDQFIFKLQSQGLSCTYPSIYRGFREYLDRIVKILDN